MKVIIAGGRDFFDGLLVDHKVMQYLKNYSPEEIEIVSGGAKGADRMGELFAQGRGLKCTVMPADWNGWGKRAGYLRNVQMAEYADALIAFWDGKSRGTKHMIDIAHEHGLKVRVVRY